MKLINFINWCKNIIIYRSNVEIEQNANLEDDKISPTEIVQNINLIDYINSSKNYKIYLNDDEIFDYCIMNSQMHQIEIAYSNFKDNIFEYLIVRYADILNGITVIIDNCESINILTDISFFLYIPCQNKIHLKIEKHNCIFLEEKKKIIIHFYFDNVIKYDNENIGGIPLFLYSYESTVFYIHINTHKLTNICDDLHVYSSWTCVLSSYIKINNIKINELTDICDLYTTNEKRIMSIQNLKFSDFNNKLNYEMKEKYYDKLLNYLNIVMYKKNLFGNEKNLINNGILKYEFELDTEIIYIVFKFNYKIVLPDISIRLNGYDIFDADIFTIYHNGYFFFKFNRKFVKKNKIQIIVNNRDEQHSTLTDEDFDDLLGMEIFEIYDLYTNFCTI